MDLLFNLFLGVGLSASCGFRVFTPLLALSIFSLSGNIELSAEFQWLSSYPAATVLLIATLVEAAAYYIPWVDNLLDTIATPLAVIAGTVVMASTVGQLDPALQWALAIVAGGGTSAVVQGSTVTLRGASSATTGGTANFMLASAENVASAGLSLLSLFLPLVAMFLLIVIIAISAKVFIKVKRKFLVKG